MPHPTQLELRTPQDTTDLAAYIAPLLLPGDVLCLYGDLGSGKTFFSQALGSFLGVEEFIDSPSFVLLKEYEAKDFPLYHFDLYRLKNQAELLDLGILDLIESGVTLIEWPELAAELLPHDYLNLSLRFRFTGTRRSVEIVARGRFSDYFL